MIEKLSNIIKSLQQQADQFAIQESNLRDQVVPLEALQRQLDQIRLMKHQAMGAVSILKQVVGDEKALQEKAEQPTEDQTNAAGS